MACLNIHLSQRLARALALRALRGLDSSSRLCARPALRTAHRASARSIIGFPQTAHGRVCSGGDSPYSARRRAFTASMYSWFLARQRLTASKWQRRHQLSRPLLELESGLNADPALAHVA